MLTAAIPTGDVEDVLARPDTDRVRLSAIAEQLIAAGHADNRPDAIRYAMLLIVAAERCAVAVTAA